MMASKTFSGQLDQAMDELAAEGNKILFIPQQNVGEVLEGAASEMTVESDGTYSIKLAYNTYSIYHYSDVTKRKRLLADGIVVSSETTVTTIPGLIGSTVPVTEDSVLTIQGYLDEANEAKTDAEEAQAATEALFDGFESSVAGSMALVSVETPSLSIPFNESGRLDYGVGTEYVSGLPVYGVNFTRSSTSTVINKSGVLETLTAGEIGIGDGGAWMHESYTNYLSSPLDISSSDWVKTSTTVSGTGTLVENDSDSTHSIRYSAGHSITLGDVLTYQVFAKLTDSRGIGISIDGGGFDDVTQKIVVNKSGDVLFTLGLSDYEIEMISDDELVVSLTTTEATATTEVGVRLFMENTESSDYLETYEGDGSSSITIHAINLINSTKNLPFLPENMTASATSCSVPVNGNLPAVGQSFTFVFDAEFNDDDTGSYSAWSATSDVSGGAILFRKNAGSLRWYHDESDGTDAAILTSNELYTVGRHRYALTFDGSTFSMYCDGTLVNSRSSSDFCWFDVDGNINFTSSYNNQLKNFKILPYAASADEVKSWGAPK